MKFQKKVIAAAIVAAGCLTGCATRTAEKMEADVKQKVNAVIQERVDGPNQAIMETIVSNDAYAGADAIDYVPRGAGNVSLQVTNHPVYEIFNRVASEGGYASIIASGLDGGRRVTVDLRNLTTEQALREVATAAGFAVAIDKKSKKAVLAPSATYTFKIPPKAFDAMEAKYSLDTSPKTSSNTSGGSAGGSANSDTGAFSAAKKGATKDSALKEALSKIAGPDTEVSVVSSAGIVTVKGSSQQLRRIQDYLTAICRDSLARVQVEAAIIEVSQKDGTQTGIDFSRALKGGLWSYEGTGAAGVTGATMNTLKYNSANVVSAIKAIESLANVKVLYAQKVVIENHQSAVMVDGEDVPYLGSINNNVSGTSGTVTNSANLSFTRNGMSTGIEANILDNRLAELTLQLTLNNVQEMINFPMGQQVLVGPRAKTQQILLPVIAEHGTTLILGGATSKSSQESNSGLPGIAKTPLNYVMPGNNKVNVEHKELMVLVSTVIVPGPEINPLVSESL